MAGDWIKMRGNLWDDPRVSRLVDLTDSSEAAIVGGLYWLWATADQHSSDGVMAGLTTKAIDRKTSIQGFGEALVLVGWIADHPEGIRIVRFEEHNGESAKCRIQTAKRVAKHTANAKLTQAPLAEQQESVSTALPREEKRREEIDIKAESKAIRAPRFDAPAHLLDLGVPLDLSADWIKLRKAKKAEVTKTAIAGIANEALKAGVTLEAALRECCSRGWAGFKAEWMQVSQQARASPKMSHSDASKLSAARAIFGTEIEGQNWNGRIIEASAAFTGSVDRQDFPRIAR